MGIQAMLAAAERRKAAQKEAPIKSVEPIKPKWSDDPKASVKPTTVEEVEKRPRGRPHSGNETVTLRISSAVLDHYRASGPGWQSRINEDLKKAVGLEKTK